MDDNQRIQERIVIKMLIIKPIDRNRFKNIIFDFDGVIAETDTARYKTLSKILLKYKIKLENDYSLSDIIGTPTDIFLKNNYPLLNNDEIINIVEERRLVFLNNLKNNCVVYPMAVETINDLNSSGYSIHLATTNERSVAQKLIAHIGINDAFKTLFFREDIVNKNTNIKDYALFLKKMNIDPKAILVIEDSIIGVRSAKNNSMFCIAFNRNDDLKLLKLADVSIKTYYDLRQIFGLVQTNSQPLH